MLVLGIESSCDETAAAVVKDGKEILSNIIASQVEFHARYGGVVPEIASRKHIEAVYQVTSEALHQADINLSAVDGIAVTRGPGLIGSLLVGLSLAKALAYAASKPLVGMHHLEGHIFSIFLEKGVAFPFIALLVSGGHTSLYRVDGPGRYQTLGSTKDDAAGEALDKIAKFLGLGYPGGVVIDKLAKSGNHSAFDFPRAYMGKDSLDFSFSGLKTAAVNLFQHISTDEIQKQLADIAASYLEAVVEVLVRKTIIAARQNNISRIVVSGGVAANSRLRDELKRAASDEANMQAYFPSPALCTDNAAMIAAAGYHHLASPPVCWLNMNAVSRWRLDDVKC